MRDFLGVLLILIFAMGILGVIVLMGLQFSYYVLILIGIVISTLGIILFIKFFPGRRHSRKKDRKK